MSDLLEMAARVEALAVGAFDIDEAIHAALASVEIEWQEHAGHNAYHRDGVWVSIGPIPKYTASLDDAVALVPEGMMWCGGDGPTRGAVMTVCPELETAIYIGKAATPALALTAACLRARALSHLSSEGAE